MKIRSPSHLLFFTLCLFLLVFPKGGIKIADIPLTCGYLLLFLISLFLFFSRKFQITKERAFSLLILLPFQIQSLITIYANGYVDTAHFMAFLVNFFFLPFIFLILFSYHLEELNLNYFAVVVKRSILLIACYGIFLFFFRLLNGNFIEIPMLTTNLHDLGELESKCINRAGIFKLISTYNNGNLYGICLLMLFPLYLLVENCSWKKNLVRLSLFLTLSRTVWIGLFAAEILYQIFVKKSRKFALKLICLLIGFALAVFVLIIAFDFSSEFLFDLTFGNRLVQFEILSDLSYFSTKPFWTITEVVYMSILESFGLFGLICFLMAMLSPLYFYFALQKKNPIKNALAMGLITYLIISLSDGAVPYIPTLCFYWFLASLTLRRKNSSDKIGLSTPRYQEAFFCLDNQ